jgi:hypothetical protein
MDNPIFSPSHLEAYFQPEPSSLTTLFIFLSPGGILPAGAQVMDAVALVAVPDAGDELAKLWPDDPEAEPVTLAGEVVDEQRVPPVPPVHLVKDGNFNIAWPTSQN